MSNSSIEVRSSRYVQGGITEIGSTGLEWWDRFHFELDATDLEYTVEEKYNGRLDLIADALYGDWRLWWFIAQYNNLLDPSVEVVQGRVLQLPTAARLQGLLSQKPGGIISQREDVLVLPPVIL